MQGASASSRTIALVTDTNDWHARALGKAFAALGVQTPLLKLPACGFDTATAHGLSLPDFDRWAAGRGTRARHGGRNL